MRTMRWLLPVACAALGACNMVISDKPMFADSDAGSVLPKDGIWLGEDEECKFDSSSPESNWPECAVWVLVRNTGRELHVSDGKGQSQRLGSLFAAGNPTIVEAQWIDDAKTPAKATYGYFGLEPQAAQNDGRFVRALLWAVDCGIQENEGSDIQPFPGISPECRPASKAAIRAAAVSSRRAQQIKRWRWLREERPSLQPTISSGLKK